MASQRHVLVLGAGVTGLTSALFLAEAGYLVTVVAAHVPGELSIDYTSPWAGAHWRTAATPSDPRLCDWDVQTYKYWVDLLEKEAQNPQIPRSGLKMQTSHLYWTEAPTEDLWWSPHVRNFRQISTGRDPVLSTNRRIPSSSATSRIRWAAAFDAPSLDPPHYLLYLQHRAAALGVRIFKALLPADDAGLAGAMAAAQDRVASELVPRRPQVDVFVNATGLAAGRLCGDAAVHPVRGQTVLVKGEAGATRTWRGDGGWTAYCISRPGSGTTVLGGTREKGVWSGEPSARTTGEILQRNAWQAPELLTGPEGGFEVLSVQCGLRPGRDGGPRVEREVVGGKRVVHSYGHSGAGFQNSVGSAREVVRLVGESLGGGKGAKL